MKPDETPWMKLVDRFSDRDKQEKPYGWIQWKGTDACIDVNCVCGALTHFDAEFAYLIQCGECKRVYWPNAFIKLVELKGEDLKLAKECDEGTGHHFVVSK